LQNAAGRWKVLRKRARGTMHDTTSEGSAGSERTTLGWGAALVRGVVIAVLCWVGFLRVPDWLLSHMTGVSANLRDAVVTLFVLLWFVILAVVFVRIQRRRRT
jgi:hypothetical protein